MGYAENTTVSAERSRAEIEKTLQKYGADQFMYGWNGLDAIVGFKMNEKVIRFKLCMPDKKDEKFTYTPSGRERRDSNASYKAWEQATRQRWRALCLVIKAKLEAIESGITTFEEEFLAHILLPNGKTVSQFALPEIEGMYKTGKMPKLLLGG